MFFILAPVKKFKKRTAEEKARCNELRRNLPVVTFDPCPHCGVVLRSKVTSALKVHIKRMHSRRVTHFCNICGKPYFNIERKLKHEEWFHLGRSERAVLRQTDPKYCT